MKLSAKLVLALFACGLTSSACGDNKAAECKQVASIAKEAVTQMHKLEDKLRGEAHETVALAADAQAFIDVIEKAAKDIGAVTITSEALRPHVTAYSRMLDAAATATRGLLGALEGATELTEAQLQATQKNMREAQKGLAEACGTAEEPPADCEKIAAVMQRFAENPPAGAAMATALDEHATELEQILIEVEAIKAAKLGYTAVLREFSKLFAQALMLDAKIEEVNIAVEKEDEIVAALNEACAGK